MKQIWSEATAEKVVQEYLNLGWGIQHVPSKKFVRGHSCMKSGDSHTPAIISRFVSYESGSPKTTGLYVQNVVRSGEGFTTKKDRLGESVDDILLLAEPDTVTGFSIGLENAIAATQMFGIPVLVFTGKTKTIPSIIKTAVIFGERSEDYRLQEMTYRFARTLHTENNNLDIVPVFPTTNDAEPYVPGYDWTCLLIDSLKGVSEAVAVKKSIDRSLRHDK